jgi:hypothetical protein
MHDHEAARPPGEVGGRAVVLRPRETRERNESPLNVRVASANSLSCAFRAGHSQMEGV